MSEESSLTRRTLLLLFAGVALSLALPEPVHAKDGDSGGGSDGSGSGSGGSGGGSDDSGGGNSDDDDSDDDDDDGDDDNSGSGSSNSGHGGNDHDDARDAVRKGKAISLSKALGILKNSEPGRVLEVKLVKRSSGFDYRFKVIAKSGKVKTVSMDAATGRIHGFLGL